MTVRDISEKLDYPVEEILTWYIGDQLYGLFLKECKEVIKNVEILSVPNSKEYLAGIHNLRGEIITVIDVSVKLGYPPIVLSKDKAVIRLKEKAKVSILADRIHDILEIPTNRLEPPPPSLTGKEAKCISSVAKYGEEIVLILNLEGLTAIE